MTNILMIGIGGVLGDIRFTCLLWSVKACRTGLPRQSVETRSLENRGFRCSLLGVREIIRMGA